MKTIITAKNEHDLLKQIKKVGALGIDYISNAKCVGGGLQAIVTLKEANNALPTNQPCA